MSDISVKPVRSSREKRLFLTFPWKIYKNDPLWVPPLLPDRRKAIDPLRGPFFQHGEAELFIAWWDGRPVGTICAAEDKAGNADNGHKDCLWGFFECIEDYSVALALWDAVIRWGKARGLTSLYGPFNLDYENAYGILVEGRTRPPAMLCGHTPPYYLDFVQRYGFEPARGQNVAFGLDLTRDNEQTAALSRMAARVRSLNRFTIRTPDLRRWEDEIDPLLGLLNAGLAHLNGHIPWRRESVRALLEQFKDFADPELVLFAEENGKMIGFFPGVANLNDVLIRANGLRYPWNYAETWLRMRRRVYSLTVKSILLLPEYWGSGVVVMLFDEMWKRAREKGYTWMDLSLTSTDNPKTPALAERMGAGIYKRYQVYRKFFK